MRFTILGIIVLVLVSTVSAYSASISAGSIKTVGGGSSSVTQTTGSSCEFGKIEAKTWPIINLAKGDLVYCDTLGTYLFEVTVDNGTVAGTGSVSLEVISTTERVKPQVTISPAVDVTGVNWTVTFNATLQ